MKIVNVASEIAPYAKTGGLADVTGSLPGALQALGHEVISFLPRYKKVDLDKGNFKMVIDRLEITLGTEKVSGRVYCSKQKDGSQVYLIDNPEFFSRDELYGTALGDYPDNDRRFVFFQRAVLETLRAIGFMPAVIHCHDWQTGLIPVYLKTTHANDAFFKKTKTLFTVHNLAYQGNFPPDSLPATGLGWDVFKLEKMEFYGKASFLKGGLVYADMVSTVSERYAKEIQTKEFGCGMEGALKQRKEHLFGVLNGIDVSEWDPSKDKDIAVRYDVNSLQKKKLNKNALQKENGLKVDSETPLLGIVTRLVDQKGLDILIPALGEFIKLGVQFVLLGTGDEKYHKILREIGKKNKERFGIHIVFDPKMAKQIYAGSDILLIPSYYEPCGLAQMIALCFGTVPLVRATGGLADTITEFDIKTREGNGFIFKDYTSEALVNTVQRALQAYRNESLWLALMKNAMACDFSWKASAKQYVRLFEMAVEGRIESSEK